MRQDGAENLNKIRRQMPLWLDGEPFGKVICGLVGWIGGVWENYCEEA